LYVTSVFISAKYYEKDSRGPTANDISNIMRGKFSAAQIIKSETQILNVLNWAIMFKTAADYVHLFLNQGVLFSNDIIMNSKVSWLQNVNSPNQEVANYIWKYSEFLLDLIIQEFKFKKYHALIIASSIIVAAWKIVGIEPTWNAEFEILF